ncbi:MAG: hypothetical protein ACRD0Q_09255 [Acidimicrobiales bacterium]
MLLATACQANVTVDVDIRADGSGQVSAGVGLDDEAVAEVGDFGSVLALDDLRQTGWRVQGPRREKDGRTWVRASKPFTSTAEAGRVVAELGPPFQGLRVEKRSSFLRAKTTISGPVDLTAGLATFSDADLGQVVDLVEVERRFGDRARRAIQVELTAELPGKVDTNSAALGGGPAWPARLGERVEVWAQGDRLRALPLLAGFTAAVALIAVGLTAWRRRKQGQSP